MKSVSDIGIFLPGELGVLFWVARNKLTELYMLPVFETAGNAVDGKLFYF